MTKILIVLLFFAGLLASGFTNGNSPDKWPHRTTTATTTTKPTTTTTTAPTTAQETLTTSTEQTTTTEVTTTDTTTTTGDIVTIRQAPAGQFLSVYAQAASGDIIQVGGDQNLNGRWTNTKHITLKALPGAPRARLIGAITDNGGLSIDFSDQPRSNWLLLDDTTAKDSANRPSWIVNYPNVTWTGFEATNHNTKIGVSPDDYTSGGSNFHMSMGYIHDIGQIWATKPNDGYAQPVQRKDGKWVGNHDHGYYSSGAIGGLVISDVLIERCSDRGFQFRSGGTGATVTRVLVRDCGMGFIWGDSNNVILTKSILLDNNCSSRYLLEEYLPGTGNKADDNFAWNADGRAVSALSKVALTNLHHVDPQYDSANFILKSSSPAIGYGPSWIQPGATPIPDPTPAMNLKYSPTLLMASSLYRSYKTSNPTEASKLEAWWAGTASKPTLSTSFGRALTA